MYKTMALLKSE